MSFRLGLTGSIGMGKSTTAQMFRDLGHPVWDADAAVHRLYATGGAAVAPLGQAFPGAVTDGAVDRARLKALLAEDETGFARLERIVHPLVAADRADFIRQHRDAPIVVLDIPLLFETGGEKGMDGIAVVSAGAELQRQRVLARPGMTEHSFAMILDRQMPDAEKRARADWVIPTETLEGARAAVDQICKDILSNA
ncbi:dephospho-CoA kinase [Paracoccus zhejiangensis]|uniref:Dephospho-CoA kinase n=1 Tax=Paracoccus zhejiangensis TaxID=1077935 RepID=A0A2H5F0M9_9RHOB|nr:dephospho-CoA kinase [Paracoccus zhejiangensis]AUH65108.1 dephospho-CoA kinase [Paracoccus zhejiangensis]